MDIFDAWEIGDMSRRIEDMERKIMEHESDYDAEDFERIMDNLNTARTALNIAWLMI